MQDLGEYGAEIDPGQAPVERRIRYIDGSVEVEYEFDASESETQPLYLTSCASFEASESDARIAYAVLHKAFEMGAGWEGMAVKPVPAKHRRTDDSFFGLLDYDGQTVGNLFVALQGKKTYFVAVSGFYFDDAEQFAALVEPRLAYLERYAP